MSLYKVAAAILLPAAFRVFVAERFFLAEAGGGKPVRGDSQRFQELLHGVRALLPQAEIVFGGSALIAIAFDDYFDLRMRAQELRGLRKSVFRVGTQVGLVVIEVGVVNFTQEHLVNG